MTSRGPYQPKLFCDSMMTDTLFTPNVYLPPSVASKCLRFVNYTSEQPQIEYFKVCSLFHKWTSYFSLRLPKVTLAGNSKSKTPVH